MVMACTSLSHQCAGQHHLVSILTSMHATAQTHRVKCITMADTIIVDALKHSLEVVDQAVCPAAVDICPN